MSELKECPFCGGEAEIERTVTSIWVQCTECKSSGRAVGVLNDNWYYKAIDIWNKRTTQDSEEQEKCDHFVYAEIDCFSFGPIVQIGKQDPESEIEFVHGVHFKFCPNCGKKLESE